MVQKIEQMTIDDPDVIVLPEADDSAGAAARRGVDHQTATLLQDYLSQAGRLGAVGAPLGSEAELDFMEDSVAASDSPAEDLLGSAVTDDDELITVAPYGQGEAQALGWHERPSGPQPFITRAKAEEAGWQAVGWTINTTTWLGERGVSVLAALMATRLTPRELGRKVLAWGPLNSPALGQRLDQEHAQQLEEQTEVSSFAERTIPKA